MKVDQKELAAAIGKHTVKSTADDVDAQVIQLLKTKCGAKKWLFPKQNMHAIASCAGQTPVFDVAFAKKFVSILNAKFPDMKWKHEMTYRTQVVESVYKDNDQTIAGVVVGWEDEAGTQAKTVEFIGNVIVYTSTSGKLGA